MLEVGKNIVGFGMHHDVGKDYAPKLEGYVGE